MMEIGTMFVPRGDLKMGRLRFTGMGLSLAMELLPREKQSQAEALGFWDKNKMKLGIYFKNIKRFRGGWQRFIFSIKCFPRRRFYK